jgi:signal transduction histidine kinase
VHVSYADGWLHIEDTGPGIPEHALPHVFDRFYQADRTHAAERGFGIGLAIGKICGRYGWQIKLESEPGAARACRCGLPVGSPAGTGDGAYPAPS